MLRAKTAVLSIVLAAALAGCGGSSSTGGGGNSGGGGKSDSSSGHGPLTVAVFQPFTGANAAFGAEGVALCAAAVQSINTTGGVLGHQLACKDFDSTDDPADAVPVANRMIATASNLVDVYGPTDPEPAVEPILNASSIVHFSDDSDPRYDHQTSPWFFRMQTSDSSAGVALALYATLHHFTHAAAVFTSDHGAQTSVPSLDHTYPRLGGSFAANLTLTPGQASYRTEAAQVISSHADAVITEMDQQTAATFLSELQQLNGGKLIPIITTSRALTSGWVRPVTQAIGVPAFKQYLVAVSANSTGSPSGLKIYTTNLMSAPTSIPDRKQYIADPYAQWGYDGIVLAALAMTEAKSTAPQKWAPLVLPIANGQPGAITVHGFADGVAALRSGKKIHYVGASGPLYFDRWHNNQSPFSGFTYDGKTQALQPTGPAITPKQLAQAAEK